jgi:peptidoglycan/LPS O-acetylase OafA/YrhL
MRGVAALAVVIFHLSLNLKAELAELLPDFINTLFSLGYLGVPLFFVISGLVISLSIKDSPITRKYAINFAIRRSIRLDPTYWASIFFGIMLLSIKNLVLDTSEPQPSFTTVLIHMFYLQDLLAIKPVISVVYWTLCLEIQLYLFYIFTVWLSQFASRYIAWKTYPLHLIVLIGVGIYSVTLDYNVTSISIPGLFLSNWHYFLMGVLVANVIRKLPYSISIFIAWVLFETAFQLGISIKPYAVVGVFSSVLIFILWRKNLLDSALTRRELQYLGRISYTLYLIHPDIGWKVISFGRLLLDDHISPFFGGVLLIVGIAASIIVAHLFHLAFERPSLWVASKLKNTTVKDLTRNLMKQYNMNK